MTQIIAPTTEKPKQRAAIKDGKLWVETDHGLYGNWEKTPGIIQDGKLYVEAPYSLARYEMTDAARIRSLWRGGKISWELWEQICAFMRWSQATYKCEALITLFYNKATGEWKAWPFPQHPVGMTIRYETNHPLYAPDRKQFGNDWIQLGSVHHHCTATAFQSGTDKSDEEDRDGIHITLGEMDKDRLSMDWRQVFDQVQSDANAINWIEMPPHVMAIPYELRFELFVKMVAYAGRTPDGKPGLFNNEWKNRVIEKKTTPTNNPANHQARGNGSASAGSASGRHSLEVGIKFREGRKRILTRICETLEISFAKAYTLVSAVDPSKLDDQDLQIRKGLLELASENLCPPMWAQYLIAEMCDEEMERTAQEAGVPDQPPDDQPDPQELVNEHIHHHL